MLDLAQLLPHCKRDAKLDTKTDRGVINEVADMKVCIHEKCIKICNASLYSWHVICVSAAAGLQQCFIFRGTKAQRFVCLAS